MMNSKKLVKLQHDKKNFTVVIWRIFRGEKHSVLYWKNASSGEEATLPVIIPLRLVVPLKAALRAYVA